MAIRPIYIPSNEKNRLVTVHEIDFEWFPGFSIAQKQRSILALHKAATSQKICERPLEISTKSNNSLGFDLSAFNLSFITKKQNKKITVEAAFQASKVFERGGPYIELLDADALTAKRYEKLKTSGDLIGFSFFGGEWPLEPKTIFYDWIYLNALRQNPILIDKLDTFDAFTDIEFNPKKSINCQAHSVALFKSLKNRGLLEKALQSKNNFIEMVGQFSSVHDKSSSDTSKMIETQQTLF